MVGTQSFSHLTRRALIAATMATALAGVGPLSAQAQQQEEIRLALSTLGAEVLDPTQGPSSGSKPIWSFLYDYLVGVDGIELSKATGVAEDWQVEHAPTQSVYTFKLRPGIKFHDGSELTSADVKFSLEYVTREGSLSSGVQGLRDTIASIETPDPQTVVVRTKTPYGNFLLDMSRFGLGHGMILPKAYIEKNGDAAFNTNPVGSGPYKIKAQTQGASITLESAGDHWLIGTPKYKEVTFLLAPEEATRIAMLQTGETDVIDTGRDRLAGLEAEGFKAFVNEGGVVLGMRMGNSWDTSTYLSDIRVREALNLAVDRETILEQLFDGQGRVSGDPFYGSWAYGYQAQPLYPYDPEGAKKLFETAVAEHGWTKVELTINAYQLPGLGEIPRMDEAIASMWNETFGDKISVTIKPIDTAANRQLVVDRKLPNTIFTHSGSNRASFLSQWGSIFMSTGGTSVVQDPKVDELIKAVAQELDLTAMGERQVDVASYVRQQHYFVPLLEVGQSFAANAEKVAAWDLGKFPEDIDYLNLTAAH